MVRESRKRSLRSFGRRSYDFRNLIEITSGPVDELVEEACLWDILQHMLVARLNRPFTCLSHSALTLFFADPSCSKDSQPGKACNNYQSDNKSPNRQLRAIDLLDVHAKDAGDER